MIHWRVEWIFPNAGNVKFCDNRCDERVTLLELLAKYCDHQPANPDQTDLMRKHLEFYQARGGPAQMRILLKAEGVKKCQNRFFELDVERTLGENLAGKTIVEFPTIYVVYDDVVKEFDLIDSGKYRIYNNALKLIYLTRVVLLVVLALRLEDKGFDSHSCHKITMLLVLWMLTLFFAIKIKEVANLNRIN